MNRHALAEVDVPIVPRIRQRSRPRRRAAAMWPGDVTPEVAMTAEVPGWVTGRARPSAKLLSLTIAGMLIADVSALLYLL